MPSPSTHQIRFFTAFLFPLWIIAGVVILIASFITAEPNNIYYTHRPYEMEILDAGYQFVWQNKKRPDYYHYKPKADTLRQAE